MHGSIPALSCGDVLACGASIFVLHRIDATGLQLLRVETGRGMRHRADVQPDWTDMVDAGLPLQDLVVRCVPIARSSQRGFVRLGRVSPRLLKLITSVVQRELKTMRFESTASVRSTLDTFGGIGSRGRKVGRQNAT